MSFKHTYHQRVDSITLPERLPGLGVLATSPVWNMLFAMTVTYVFGSIWDPTSTCIFVTVSCWERCRKLPHFPWFEKLANWLLAGDEKVAKSQLSENLPECRPATLKKASRSLQGLCYGIEHNIMIMPIIITSNN